MIKKFLSFGILALALFLIPSFASAQSISFTEEELKNAQEFWDKAGFDKETQKIMLDKLKNGELPDNTLEDSEPVKIEESREGSTLIKKTYYEDGTYTIEKEETPLIQPTMITTFNKNVSKTNALLNMSFDVRYTLVGGISSYDYINEVSNPILNSWSGSLTRTDFGIMRKYETGTQPAYAELRAQHQVQGTGLTRTFYIGIEVGRDTYNIKSNI